MLLVGPIGALKVIKHILCRACFRTLFWISKGSVWRVTGRPQGSFHIMFWVIFLCLWHSNIFWRIGVGGWVGKAQFPKLHFAKLQSKSAPRGCDLNMVRYWEVWFRKLCFPYLSPPPRFFRKMLECNERWCQINEPTSPKLHDMTVGTPSGSPN